MTTTTPPVFHFGATSRTSLTKTITTGHQSKRSGRQGRRHYPGMLHTKTCSATDMLFKFESFRAAFLQQFGTDINKALECVLGTQIKLFPAPLAFHLQHRFIQTCGDLSSASLKVCPAFHGTPANNFESIFQRGLLVPSQGNELQVVNGAAHGTGIYTANVNASWLSATFCSESKMLVCAVLQTSEVKHVKDAQVVSNDAHVLPLFVAEGSILQKTKQDQDIPLPHAIPVSWLLEFKPVLERKEAGFTVADFYQAGYAAAALRWAGHSALELKGHYSVCDLYKAGYKPSELLQIGGTLTDLMQAGCPKAHFPVPDLLQLGYTLENLQQAGCDPARLKELGFKATDLRKAGFTAVQLRWGGSGHSFTIGELREAGFTACDLKWVCTVSELEAAGFTAAEAITASLFGDATTAIGAADKLREPHEVPIPDNDDGDL